MTDKFRRTQTLNITFTDGEQPTAQKLGKIPSQSRAGTRLLERAIGDLWNQSGDSLLNAYPLQIPNLARLIGEMKYMNPVLYPVKEQFTYIDHIGDKYVNTNDAPLQFMPTATDTVSAVGGSSNLLSKKASPATVVAAGDWYIDMSTGRLRTFTAINSTDKIQYTVDSSTWATTTEVLPGVIPDPKQTSFTGCRISSSVGTYYIHLPPRLPLTLTGFDKPDRYPPSLDWTDNQATVIGSPRRLWQSSISAALADEHYRYRLPEELIDTLDSLSVGDQLPEGFILLWNQNTRTIVDDALFYKGSSNWVLEVSSSSLDLSTLTTSTESQTSYNSTGLSIIVPGAPISRSIYQLSKTLLSGKHANNGDLTPLLSHTNLLNTNPPDSSHSEHGGTFPTTVPIFTQSRWAWDDHVSLLSRAGSQGTDTGFQRDVNDNAMLGDLVLASSTASSGNYLNHSGDSRKLYFGKRLSTSPYLYSGSGGTTITIANASLVLSRNLYLAQQTDPNGVSGALSMLSAGNIRPQVNDSEGYKGIPIQLYSSVSTSSTITGVTAEAAFDINYTLPANTLKVGTTVKVKVIGRSTAATSNTILRIRVGGLTGTQVCTRTISKFGSPDPFIIEAFFTVRSIGSSGTYFGGGTIVTGEVAGAPSSNAVASYTSSARSINTTIAQQIVATADLADTNNVSLENFIVEIA